MLRAAQGPPVWSSSTHIGIMTDYIFIRHKQLDIMASELTDLTAISLFPPLVVLIIGVLTHRVMLSLSAGIILSALLATGFAPIATIQVIAVTLWDNLEFSKFFSSEHFWQSGNLFICIFLLMLGIFITMLQVSGGAYAYSVFAKRKIQSKKSAETSSLVLSCGLFVDDYLSSLTVGSVMYPLTDSKHVPRAKLAYLVDSLSGPLAILCPFSSWVAAIVGFLGDNGVSEHVGKHTQILANPLTMFLQIIPYLFYSFVLFCIVWFVVRSRISFGLMKKHEDLAKSTGNLFGGAKQGSGRERHIEHNPQHTTLLEFFLPIIVLLLSVFTGILYSGRWVGFGGHNSFITAFQQASAAAGLFIGGNITVVICTLFFILRGRIKVKALPGIYWDGIKLMYTAVIVLVLAWTFGDFLRNHLHSGEYLASLMLNSVNITVLPMILFFTGFLIAFTIGSAWGTAAMMFPIVIPLVLTLVNAGPHPTLAQIPIIFPILGATLSGCVAGNHVSPIADTTIMSSLSTHVKLKDHIYTQLQYALPGIVIVGFSFLLSSLLLPYGKIISILMPVVTAVLLNAAVLTYLSKRAHRSH